MKDHSIHIGTSGWHFESWEGTFYSDELSKDAFLATYAKTFQTVELNNSFYQLPERKEIESWKEKTPENFLFSCKASRYITHMKKLKDPKEGIGNLLEALEPFGEKLGPILFQLPGQWKVNKERLARFVEALPDTHLYTFEFRDKTWLCEEVYELLASKNIALCIYDYKGYQSPEIPTADFIYVRLHGPEQEAYTGSYDGRTLAGYAQKFLRWSQEEEKTIYCYFDNDKKAKAPFDAQKLMESITRQS